MSQQKTHVHVLERARLKTPQYHLQLPELIIINKILIRKATFYN